MRPAYVSLGSNIDPERNLLLGLAALARIGLVRRVSPVYESEAAGPPGQPRFLNAVVQVEVQEDDETLRSHLRRLESDLGRLRTDDKYAPRPIDLDLIAREGFIDPGVRVHAYLAVPLADIAPDLRLGSDGETASKAADRLRHGSDIRPRPDVLLDRPKAEPE